MINKKKVLVVIPARSGSKGLPNKNIKVLCGLPLLGWPINAALGSKYIDSVIVSTDDQKIAELAKELGAETPFIRPDKIATDTSPTHETLLHALDYLASKGQDFDYIVLLEPTSPLTESSDIDNALDILESNHEIADAIVGVSKVHATHPSFCISINSKGLVKPYQGKAFDLPVRRQEIDDVYFFDGSLYISEVKKYRQETTFYHDRTLPYVVPQWKSLEVDTLLDFVLIETVMKNRNQFKTV